MCQNQAYSPTTPSSLKQIARQGEYFLALNCRLGQFKLLAFKGHKEGDDSTSRTERKIVELRSVATQIFEHEPAMTYRSLVQAVCDLLHIKDRQAKTDITFMGKHGILCKSEGTPALYSLISG